MNENYPNLLIWAWIYFSISAIVWTVKVIFIVNFILVADGKFQLIQSWLHLTKSHQAIHVVSPQIKTRHHCWTNVGPASLTLAQHWPNYERTLYHSVPFFYPWWRVCVLGWGGGLNLVTLTWAQLGTYSHGPRVNSIIWGDPSRQNPQCQACRLTAIDIVFTKNGRPIGRNNGQSIFPHCRIGFHCFPKRISFYAPRYSWSPN